MQETKTRVAREREKGGNPARYYRKQYIKETRIKFLSQAFDIHHLDHNWQNNKPANLVALPKDLHDRWHRYANKGFVAYAGGRFFIDTKFIQDERREKPLAAIMACICEISRWIDYRDFLLGTIGLNLHSLSYE